jgi:acetyl esterase/lipase/predicted dehydrogenase
MSARSLHELTVEEARSDQAAELPPGSIDPRVVVRDLAGPVPIRLFLPRAAGMHPLCLWFPGGGWVLDTLGVSGASLSRLAAETPCAVAAVRYRLAPEHRFPVPLEDCAAALRWLVRHGRQLGVDPARIAVGGTSAGANLAAALALVSREAGSPDLALQVLVYPPLLYGSDTESVRSEGLPSFDRRDLRWCWSHYLARAADGENPLASPLLATELSGLPPALVVTAEHDPVRDEAELYADRLQRAGVDVEAVRVDGAAHGFFSDTDETATSAQRLVAAALGRTFRSASPPSGGARRARVRTIDHRPAFPKGRRPGIGIVGCGQIVRNAHLPAYAQYGCDVVGIYDVRPEATQGLGHHVFGSFDELLADQRVEIVDIATHPDVRVELIRRAIESGKHVLAQKPLASDLDEARAVVDEAERHGVTLAVNQNGRWAPAWRIATSLIEQGAVGEVHAITHLLDRDFAFVLQFPHFDEFEHLVIYDHCVHWIDISRCWLDGKAPESVRALEYRSPGQPAETKQAWGAWIDVHYSDGSSAMVRSVGGSQTETPGCPFWVHGSEGTIRGSILLGSDFVELERDGAREPFRLDGAWYVDGFAGAMAELMSALAEGREPYNSARHNLLSLELTLAAVRSAEADGRPVRLT